MREQEPAEITELDLSDVDHRVGQPVGGGQLWDPCSSSDIRRAFLRERLASYKVPRRVLFFRADEIALTGSAKIKAGDLRELAAKAVLPQA